MIASSSRLATALLRHSRRRACERRVWRHACGRITGRITATIFLTIVAPNLVRAEAPAFRGTWQRAENAIPWFEVRGTGGRSNPVRRELASDFTGSEIYATFSLRYDAASIDLPGVGDGEFFVMWFDDHEGGQSDSHSGVPNVGIHVSGQENRFMVRFASMREQYAAPLVGDREFRLVARLSRQAPDGDGLDRLELWVDPPRPSSAAEAPKPDAQVRGQRPLKVLRWVGYSTGRKTEPTDRIHVSAIRLSNSWERAVAADNEPPPLEPPDLSDFVVVDNSVSIEPTPTNADAPDAFSGQDAFAQQIAPLLRRKCFACHAGDDASSGVRLDIWDELLNTVKPRDGEGSPLVARLRSDTPDERMPPEGPPLAESEIQTIIAWIDAGVAWDETVLPTPTPQTNHWSFQPLGPIAVPQALADDPWVRSPVDAFVLRKLRDAELAPAPLADASTLRRRLSLDLAGLPPRRELQITRDTQSDADRWVDQLLQTQAYGERWGRHWLDLARWSESNGHQHNRRRPHAWRYRDYVIDAFAAGKPFDQFIVEQVAGDLLPNASDSQIIATGFLAAARYSGNELDKSIQRNNILVDVANTTSKAMLGITLECAQCHTHKFDPLSLRDYYRFQACFADGQPGNLVLGDAGVAAETHELVHARWHVFEKVEKRMIEQRRAKDYPEPVLVSPKSVKGGMRGDERRLFQSVETAITQLPQAWAWRRQLVSPAALPIANTNTDTESTIPASPARAAAPHEMRWPLGWRWRTTSRPVHLLIRGDLQSPGPQVQPGWPAVFGQDFQPAPNTPARLALAQWLVHESNPLTARVWVNRVWQWHFGRGLVETSADFGTQGELPTHPKLLDYLANELMESGWDTSHIHRLILQSNTYRQAAVSDGSRQLYRGWIPRRLESEAIRDCILETAGQLEDKPGGPSVSLGERGRSRRRSVYLTRQRQRRSHQERLFDAPAGATACSRRHVSTAPMQPLYLLNDPWMQKMSAALAQRVRAKTDETAPTDQLVAATLEVIFGRPAIPAEVERMAAFVSQQQTLGAADPLAVLCHSLLNVSEFIYIP